MYSKTRETNKAIESGAKKHLKEFFNDVENLWVGDTIENSAIQEDRDPMPGWSPQKLAGHFATIKNRYYLK